MASAEKRIFKCDFFTSTYISGLESLRSGNHLNDIVLDVQGRKFSCHKLVLAANSKYFLTMFTANVNERNMEEIRLPAEIAPEAMETLLDYFYSGELPLSQSIIESVFKATDYMRLDSLLEVCMEYMQETLNLSNSVQRFVLTETIQYSCSRSDDLKKASSALIVNGVEEISGREEFLNLSKENVSPRNVIKSAIFSISSFRSQKFQPKMTEFLYRVILKWVSHDEDTRKQFLYDLLETLPVEGISYNFLATKMGNEELLRKDSKSVLWLMDAMSRLTTASLTQSQPSSFLFGDRDSDTEKCFLVKKVDHPTPQAIHDLPKIDRFSAVSYKRRMYLLCSNKTEKSYQLDDPHEPWVECNLDLKFERRSAGCVILGDDLFIVGGYNWKNDSLLNSYMKFNFCSGQKQSLPAMGTTRLLPGVAVYANSLYVTGGSLTPEIKQFDPREGRWCAAGQYTTKFGACCATIVADCLYCCGVFNGIVERFDFRINRSQEIYSLPSVSGSQCGWISSVENDLLGASGDQIFIYDGVADRWHDFCSTMNMTKPIILPWV